MDISSRNDFAATPDRVAEMLLNKEFLEQVCRASEPISFDVVVDGSRTQTQRVLPVPPQGRRFAGDTLTITEVADWGPAQADGSRAATVTINATGLPVSLNGKAVLAPGGRGTTVDYTGEFKINIPLIGKKLEKEAAPTVMGALQIQQQQGDDWLASHA